MLEGKKILLAVTGSIAAYKSAFLIRLLKQSGAEVRVIMSPGALEFVTPLTLSTLSGNPVVSDFTESKESGTWTRHVDMALWADLLLIAPLSANTLSKMVSGQSDNFLLATYMSARCPVMIAPAMDHDMFLHPGTQDNLRKVRDFGHIVLDPGEGELASGLMGKGRMMEPEEIFLHVRDFFHPDLPLRGKKALVTAGPTYEMIDPVRFIGNFSSGKMGFAIAEELSAQGAEVTLITGPVNVRSKDPNIHRVDVLSASEMYEACHRIFPETDIAVMAAAVADYRPVEQASQKVKKKGSRWAIELEETQDIAASLGKIKKHQLLIGFALETESEMEHATAKLEKKKLDFIVLNSLREEGAGFGTETNKVTLIWPGNKKQDFGLKAKSKVAMDITREIIRLVQK